MLEEEVAVEEAGPVFDPPVYLQRYTTVRDILYKLPGIEKVVDFGCSDGKFIKYLKKLPFVNEIVAVDLNEVCVHLASQCSRPIAWDFIFRRHSPLVIKVYKGDISEKDSRLQGFDAVTCIELIEHLQPSALESLPENVFGFIHPKIAIFTTPNSDFNVLFPKLKGFRHWDHKFEWSRNEFSEWCASITTRYPEYSVEMKGVGEAPSEHSDLGFCSQMAIFKLKDSASRSDSESQCAEAQPYHLISENEYPGRA